MRVIGSLIPVLALILGLSGCSYRLHSPESGTQIRTKAAIKLNGHSFDLHFSRPAGTSPGRVLIVYATGDGGWFGLGREIFDWLATWNYPVVGFSSRSYVHNLGYVSETGTTTPRLLARDYESIIAAAEGRLGLPASTPIILVGVSRGAGLSVVAAGARSLDQRLAGLVAIALTKEEEHVVRQARRARPGQGTRSESRVMIETYRYLNRLGSLPIMVLQSTRDDYLPAEEARKLFGPESDIHKLRAVEASDHSFHNGRQTLYRETGDALNWIVSLVRK